MEDDKAWEQSCLPRVGRHEGTHCLLLKEKKMELYFHLSNCISEPSAVISEDITGEIKILRRQAVSS